MSIEQALLQLDKHICDAIESSGGGGGGGTLIDKVITAEGEYLPSDDNADGYSKVTVEFPLADGTFNRSQWQEPCLFTKLEVGKTYKIFFEAEDLPYGGGGAPYDRVRYTQIATEVEAASTSTGKRFANCIQWQYYNGDEPYGDPTNASIVVFSNCTVSVDDGPIPADGKIKIEEL